MTHEETAIEHSATANNQRRLPFVAPSASIARSRKHGAVELTLEQDVSSLATPMAMVQMRRLIHLHPSQERKK